MGEWKLEAPEQAKTVAVEICKQGTTNRLFQQPRGHLSTFLAPCSQKGKFIRTIVWKSCRFCLHTFLVNASTFGTPGSCTRITRVHTLQRRLWGASNHMLSDSCFTCHTAQTWCLVTTGSSQLWNGVYRVSCSQQRSKLSTQHTSSSTLSHQPILH